jgi:predicted DNA-binding protein
MKAKNKKIKLPEDGRKVINLPDEVLIVLDELAEADGRPIKNYIERLVINHVKEVCSKKTV